MLFSYTNAKITLTTTVSNIICVTYIIPHCVIIAISLTVKPSYKYLLQDEEVELAPKKKQSITFWVTVAIIITVIVVGLGVGLGVAYGVKRPFQQSDISRTKPLDGNVTVFYAGSLVSLMHTINPAFTLSTNLGVLSTSASSGVLATKLQTGVACDVFISAAAAKTIPLLTSKLPNSTSHVIDWYTFWAGTSLGLGYNINSIYANTFKSIANGSIPWYKGLDPKNMKIGGY